MDRPQLFPDLSLKENENRVDFLDYLFYLDGRDREDHPLRCRYTGLAEKFALDVGRIFVHDTIAAWDEEKEVAWNALREAIAMDSKLEEEGDAAD